MLLWSQSSLVYVDIAILSLLYVLYFASCGRLCATQQILTICSGRLKGIILKSILHSGPLFTLRAILSLMMELGPEFFRGKPWVSVISSSANRMLKGTVRFPRVHLCLSSFTCGFRQKGHHQLSPFFFFCPMRVIWWNMNAIREDLCSITSTSSSCLLGLWTRNEKQSSHSGSLVLKRIFKGSQVVC